MRIALLVDVETGVSTRDFLTLAHHLDGTAIETLLASDHFAPPDDLTRDNPDSWTLCAAAAAQTHSLRFGTLVSPMSFHQPVALAKAAATVTELGGRPADLGIGIGWDQHEHRMAGLELPASATRYEQLAEYLAVVRGVLHAAAPISVTGAHHSLHDAEYHPRPSAPPRIIVGKRGRPRSVGVAARWADEYNLTFATPEHCTETIRVVAAACARVGRPPIDVSALTDVIVGETDDEISRELDRAGRRYPRLRGLAARDLPTPFLVGTREVVRRRIEAYQQTGLSRIVLKVLNPDRPSALDPLLDLAAELSQETAHHG